ncbi:MAG: sigma-54 dependent transcriptional regulator [Planctomycetaceae bacterium]
MKALEVALICSASPGFLRSVGSLMAGQCRLMECYSLPEAAQMIQLHRPDIAVFDVRSASPQQLARTFATISHVKSVDCVLVTVPGQMSDESLPEEVMHSTRMIALTSHDENYHELVEEILRPEKKSDLTPLVNEAVAELFDGQLTSPSMQGTVEPLNHASRLSPTRMNGSDDLRNRNEVTDSAPGQMAEKFRTRTPELRTMLKRLEVAARHNVTILLIGETGAGKTHLASLIHEHSTRSNEPFLHVACGALPGELIESELFGHVKGAFTSAHADKDGKFLVAGSGTILLDEIDVLTPDQQVKLLRVIEKGEFEPVGSNKTLHVKARIIAASNLQLQPLVESGRFRPDLYYRLNTLSFTLPPLRKRLPDIEPLARFFVHQHASNLGIDVVEITPDFLDCLLNYPWPGNVREMENAIRSAVIYSHDGRMTPDTLPSHVVDGHAGPGNDPSVAAFFSVRRGESLENRIELTEKDIIEQALLSNSFSRTNTAKHLGISRVTLYNKMRKYGILPER